MAHGDGHTVIPRLTRPKQRPALHRLVLQLFCAASSLIASGDRYID